MLRPALRRVGRAVDGAAWEASAAAGVEEFCWDLCQAVQKLRPHWPAAQEPASSHPEQAAPPLLCCPWAPGLLSGLRALAPPRRLPPPAELPKARLRSAPPAPPSAFPAAKCLQGVHRDRQNAHPLPPLQCAEHPHAGGRRQAACLLASDRLCLKPGKPSLDGIQAPPPSAAGHPAPHCAQTQGSSLSAGVLQSPKCSLLS